MDIFYLKINPTVIIHLDERYTQASSAKIFIRRRRRIKTHLDQLSSVENQETSIARAVFTASHIMWDYDRCNAKILFFYLIN